MVSPPDISGAGVSSGIAYQEYTRGTSVCYNYEGVGILLYPCLGLSVEAWQSGCVERSLISLSMRLREGEVIGWKVKGVSVSSRSRAEGSLSGLLSG